MRGRAAGTIDVIAHRRVDYPEYARIVNRVHDVAGRIASLDHRLIVDRPKPDPAGPCVA